MASLPPKKPDQDKRLRDEADDEDLIHALSAIRGSCRHPERPKIRVRGPEQPGVVIRPLLIQLEPIHRVFRIPSSKPRDFSIQAHSDDTEKPIFTASVAWKRDPPTSETAMIDWLALEHDRMSLTVSEGLGRFTVQTEGYSIEEQCSVDEIELLGCAPPDDYAEMSFSSSILAHSVGLVARVVNIM